MVPTSRARSYPTDDLRRSNPACSAWIVYFTASPNPPCPIWQPSEKRSLPAMSANPNTAQADPVAAVSVCNELHAWECSGAQSAEALSKWVSERLVAHESALAALLAIDTPRTPENTLRLYD